MNKLVSRLYTQGSNEGEIRVAIDTDQFDAVDAKRKIKTRTRRFVEYLKSQFSDRFEFFIEARFDNKDVVHIGDRKLHKNFEIEIDYSTSRVCRYLKKGVQVFSDMLSIEKWLGRERRVIRPQWASKKELKIKRQLERLMTRKNSRARNVRPQHSGAIMVFEMTF